MMRPQLYLTCQGTFGRTLLMLHGTRFDSSRRLPFFHSTFPAQRNVQGRYGSLRKRARHYHSLNSLGSSYLQ